jgi:hypothetical protein
MIRRSTRSWRTSIATRSTTFQRGFGPHAPEIMGDIPNYTDQTPLVQISEVLVDKG